MPTAAQNAAPEFIHESTGLPPVVPARPLAANAQAGFGQFVTVDPATGLAALNDGATPGQIGAGIAHPSKMSDVSSVAGSAYIRLSQRWVEGLPASEEAGDGFTDADFGRTFFIADENTPGKLSNFGGDNRSIGGVVFGIGPDGNPVLWVGPVAWLLGRAAHSLDAFVGGSFEVADGAANATIAERAIVRQPVHGVVTAIEFIGAAVTADDTNNATITISKRDGAGGAPVVVGTYSTDPDDEGAITAFTPAAFTLSGVAGALNLLETDILTVTVAKGGSGQTLTGAIRVIQKVI